MKYSRENLTLLCNSIFCGTIIGCAAIGVLFNIFLGSFSNTENVIAFFQKIMSGALFGTIYVAIGAVIGFATAKTMRAGITFWFGEPDQDTFNFDIDNNKWVKMPKFPAHIFNNDTGIPWKTRDQVHYVGSDNPVHKVYGKHDYPLLKKMKKAGYYKNKYAKKTVGSKKSAKSKKSAQWKKCADDKNVDKNITLSVNCVDTIEEIAFDASNNAFNKTSNGSSQKLADYKQNVTDKINKPGENICHTFTVDEMLKYHDAINTSNEPMQQEIEIISKQISAECKPDGSLYNLVHDIYVHVAKVPLMTIPSYNSLLEQLWWLFSKNISTDGARLQYLSADVKWLEHFILVHSKMRRQYLALDDIIKMRNYLGLLHDYIAKNAEFSNLENISRKAYETFYKILADCNKSNFLEKS